MLLRNSLVCGSSAINNDITSQILSGPRKRIKKRYILFLFSKSAQSSPDVKAIEKCLARDSAEQVVIRLHAPDEGLKVLMLKTIDLVVVDHSVFQDESTSAEFASELKRRRKVPVLFVCKDEQNLIQAYRRVLPLYEELDDYVLSPVDPADFLMRYRRSSSGTGRTAKRFEVDSPISVFRLNDGSLKPGVLKDLSLVGMGIRYPSERLKRGEQIRAVIHLKNFDIFHPHFADIFRISARVRRVGLDGETIGCSLEFVTPAQNECLTQMLDYLARRAYFKSTKKAFY